LTVGNEAVIANALVTRDVPPRAVVIGNVAPESATSFMSSILHPVI
jgi:hypothetical protein